MGEPSHGLAIFFRLHARHTLELQQQRRRHQLCQQAGLRVLCAGAQCEEDRTQGLCGSIHSQPEEVEAGQDEVEEKQLETYCEVASAGLYISCGIDEAFTFEQTDFAFLIVMVRRALRSTNIVCVDYHSLNPSLAPFAALEIATAPWSLKMYKNIQPKSPTL